MVERNVTESTVPYAELRKLMSEEEEKFLFEDIKKDLEISCKEWRNRNIQIRIISFDFYERNKDFDYPETFNYRVNHMIADAIGDDAFRKFSRMYSGQRMSIWLPDPDVVDRKERNKAIINDYLGGETSYAELALRHGTSKDNVRQIVCRYKKKQSV